MTNLRTAKYMADGTAIDDPNDLQILTAAQVAATQGLVSNDGIPAAAAIADGLPCFLMGGDHPYAQWQKGFAPSYAAAGIKPYLAINTDANANIINPGQTDMLSWAGVAALAPTVEIMSHGARHVQSWERINTGVTIVYTGANGTATVACTTTTLTCTDSGANNFTLASYTLASLKTAIEALPGWSVTLAAELAGTEAAKHFAAIASTSVKTTGVNFCCGGGIAIKYNGSAYRDVQVRIVSGSLRIYGDGTRIAFATLTGATVTTVVAALDGAVTGLVVKPCDNRKSDNAAFFTYLTGSELCDGMKMPAASPSCTQAPVLMQLGLPQWYMVERQFVRSKAQAAANGVTINSFANSGNDFSLEYVAGHNSFTYYRGNRIDAVSTTLPTQPKQIPTWMAGDFAAVFQLSASYGYTSIAQETAVFDALADSPGFSVSGLVHKVLRDASSPYDFSSTDPSYYDITEANWTTLTANIATHVTAGRLKSVYPSELKKYSGLAKRPPNLIFNPKFKNSGESALNLSNNSVVLPGWNLNTSSTNYSSVSISAANESVTLTCANGSDIQPLAQAVYLEPGKTYLMGFYVEHTAYVSGAGVYAMLAPEIGRNGDAYLPGSGATGTQLSAKTGGVDGLVSMRVSIPLSSWAPARIVSSVAFPIDMSVNKNISFNGFFLGAFDVDLSVGAASATSVKAHEAAAAFNTAMKANASYPAEWQPTARAENGRLVIEAPRRSYDQSSIITIAAGSTLSITTAVFTTTDSWSMGLPQDANPFAAPVQFKVGVAMSNGAGVVIKNPFVTSWDASR